MSVGIIVLIIFLSLIGLAIIIVPKIIRNKKISEAKEEVNQRLYNKEEFTPELFKAMMFKMKNYKFSIDYRNVPGCYVFQNITKNLNYVGQSTKVFNRVNQHINGKGNGDVYADMKYGDQFKIFIVQCPVEKLHITEKHLIREYNCLYPNGYNKNSGIGDYC